MSNTLIPCWLRIVRYRATFQVLVDKAGLPHVRSAHSCDIVLACLGSSARRRSVSVLLLIQIACARRRVRAALVYFLAIDRAVIILHPTILDVCYHQLVYGGVTLLYAGGVPLHRSECSGSPPVPRCHRSPGRWRTTVLNTSSRSVPCAKSCIHAMIT